MEEYDGSQNFCNMLVLRKRNAVVLCEIVRSVFACRWSCGHDFFAIDQWLGFCETPSGSPVIETGNIYTSILSKALFRWP